MYRLLLLLSLLSAIPAIGQDDDQDSTLEMVYPVPADTLPPTRSYLYMASSVGAGGGGGILGPASMGIVFVRLPLGVISLGGGGVSGFYRLEQFVEGPAEQVRCYRLAFGQEIEWDGWSTTASIGAAHTLGHLQDPAGSERKISTLGVTIDLTAFPRAHTRFSWGIHLTGNINTVAPYAALMGSLRFQFQ